MALTDWYCDDVLSGKLLVERVFEDERVLAFHHPQPAALPHVVVVPKLHVSSLLAPEALHGDLLVSMVTAVLADSEEDRVRSEHWLLRSRQRSGAGGHAAPPLARSPRRRLRLAPARAGQLQVGDATASRRRTFSGSSGADRSRVLP